MDILQKAIFGAVAGASIGFIQFSFNSISKSREKSNVVHSFNSKYPFIQNHSDLHFCLMQLHDYIMYDDPKALPRLYKSCNLLMQLYTSFNTKKNSGAKVEELIPMSKNVFSAGCEVKTYSEDVQSSLIAGRSQDHKHIVDTVQLIQKIATDIWYNVYMDTDVHT